MTKNNSIAKENKKIIIVGAGGAGLAILNCMLKSGFKDIVLLEKENELGGVWYTTNYPDLRIHSKSFNYRFLDFHSVQSKTDRATKSEILFYMNDYAREKNLYSHIKFNTKVNKVIYHQNLKKNTCEVYATDLKSNEEQELNCDILILALGFSNAGAQHVPHFPGEYNFNKKIVHSSQFSNEMLLDIVNNKKTVAVLGAGKSAQDIISTIYNRGNNKIFWLYRKSLWSVSFEKMYSKKTSRFSSLYYELIRILRRKVGKYNWIMYLLERPLVWVGLVVNPLEPHTDIYNSRSAIMTDTQFQTLKKIKSIKTEITKLEDSQIILSNGNQLNVDYLICATGYERATNIPEILIKDTNNELIKYEPKLQHAFFRNMIDPNIINIAFFTAESIFTQQIFGFSIAAEWLARFYSNKLSKSYSSTEIKSMLEKYSKNYSPWCSEKDYLSKGVPYVFNNNAITELNSVMKDLNFDKHVIWQLITGIVRQDEFETVCEIINNKLNQK